MMRPNPKDLEARLDHYAERSAAQRSASPRSWLLYSAATGAALVAAPAAEAAISYSGPMNLQINATAGYPGSDSSQIDIDLDGDFQNDFRFRVFAGRQQETTSTYFATSFRAENPALLAGNSLIGGGGQIDKLSYGAAIDSLAGFVASGALYRTFQSVPSAGTFTGTGFAGARFLISGNTHYGWIQIQVNRTGPGTGFLNIIDWAYETTPDTPIDAGQTVVPEPSALSLLALGTAGLGFYRRKRTRLAAPEQRGADAA